MSSSSETYIISGSKPLRGYVELSSDKTLSLTLIALALSKKLDLVLKGDFIATEIEQYLNIFNSYNLGIRFDHSNVNVSSNYSLGENAFITNTFVGKLIVLIYLSQKGYIELQTSKNKEFVDFLSYVGFQVESTEEKTVIYNKIQRSRQSLTFHKHNYTYTLLSIIALSINSDEFSISLGQANYQTFLFLESLREMGVTVDIQYRNFIYITFDFTTLNQKISNVNCPCDVNELVFYCVASLCTGGEIEISGIDPSFVANSLKMFSSVGGGYSVSKSVNLKIWGPDSTRLKTVQINDNDIDTLFTRICFIPLLSRSEKLEGEFSSLSLTTKKYKSLIQDLNRLGLALKVTKNTIKFDRKASIKRGTLYLEKNKNASNYTKLLAALCTNDIINIHNVSCLESISGNIYSKLKNLGAPIKKHDN